MTRTAQKKGESLHRLFSVRVALIMAALACVTTALPADPAQATQRRGEQNDARKQLMAGQVLSLAEIKARVIPRMGGMRYLSHDYDAELQVYTLRFMRGNRVVFVYVDARTANILRTVG